MIYFKVLFREYGLVYHNKEFMFTEFTNIKDVLNCGSYKGTLYYDGYYIEIIVALLHQNIIDKPQAQRLIDMYESSDRGNTVLAEEMLNNYIKKLKL